MAGIGQVLANPGPGIIRPGLILSLDAGLSASYSGSGTAWTDLSGNNRTGTLTNGPTFSTIKNGNILFDGSNDYVTCGSITGLGTSTRTVDVWFTIVAYVTSGLGRVFALPAADTAIDQPAMTLGFNTTTPNIGMGGTPYDCYVTLPAFSTNTWVNVVGTASGNSFSAYVNGAFYQSDTNTGAIGANPIAQLGRYNANYGQYGNVRVAQFRIYNRVLSAAEIAQNFNANRGRYGV